VPIGNVAKVDAYLSKLPDPQRKALERLRAQIRAAAPKAEEGFGYGIPGFYLDGPLFYYGAGKAHCALYGTRPAGFDKELAPFKLSKGTVRFAPDEPLPATLVRRLVKAKAAQNRARATARRG
jgi:uncharacterized protein YdhG (YjbR/CyaY superfamily)